MSFEQLNNPRAIAEDINCNVWVFDNAGNYNLSKINPLGQIVYQHAIDPYGGQGFPQRMILGPGTYSSNIYIASWANGISNSNQVAVLDTTTSNITSNLVTFGSDYNPNCITHDYNSNLYIGFGNGLVKKIDLSDNSQTIIVNSNVILFGGLVGITYDFSNQYLYFASPSNISGIDLNTGSPPYSSADFTFSGAQLSNIVDIMYGGQFEGDSVIICSTPCELKLFDITTNPNQILGTLGIAGTPGFLNGFGYGLFSGGPNAQHALFSTGLSALALLSAEGSNLLYMVDSGNNAIRFLGPYGVATLYPPIPDVQPCFLEGTRILCKVKPTDKLDYYVPIEQIKKGTLVKTSRDGYKKVILIGKASVNNTDTDERTEHRLYKLTPDNYSELKEDLYITGHHSVLVDSLTDQQKEETLKYVADVFGTDGKVRLMARVDDRAVPWQSAGTYTIWHFALETDDVYKNFGVYANGGLLVETCCIKLLKEEANMTFV